MPATQPCPKCGTVPEPDAHFCGVCGDRLNTQEAPADMPLPRPEQSRPVRAPAPSASPIPAPAPRPMPAPAPHLPPLSPLPAPAPAGAVAAALAAEPSGRVRASPLDKIIGRTLNNRYVIQRKIGEGGFGAVFEGRQVATGRPVALKVLHPHNVSDSTVVARFRREAEACSKLRNSHTVILYDFDETPDGILYLAMELVRGRSLQQLQRGEGPLPPARVLTILHQVA